MKNKRLISLLVITAAFALIGTIKIFLPKPLIVSAQEKSPAQPTPATEFDQEAALAKLREQIKGKENEPAEKVFKNIQSLKGVPASRLLTIMNFGYARSLGVNCTHCHTPDKWEAEDKTQKQTAREMSAMVAQINGTYLKNIKNLKSENPVVNCTTCHRGEIKPALNLPTPAKN